MCDQTSDLTVFEFVDMEKKELDAFAKFWDAQSTEYYPKRMPVCEWVYQYQSWSSESLHARATRNHSDGQNR